MMKSYPPHISDHPAWQQAWRLRCCPPDRLLTTPPSPALLQHLELCPWCRESMEDDLHLPPCPQIPESLAPPHLTADQPKPGQLYTLRQDLAGWGEKERYYNPPVVLILACPETEAVIVSQTYGDPALASPGDVALGSGYTGFAQPWNTYTLLRSDLQTCLGAVDDSVWATIGQRDEQDPSSPLPGTLLWFFRQMEVETGYFFSCRAVERLMTAHENRSLSFLGRATSSTIVEDLHSLPVRLPVEPQSEVSLLDLFLHTEPDDRLLPLAAADSETQPALRFTLQDDRIIGAELLQMSITLFDYAQGVLTVTGTIEPPLPGNHTWICRWQAGEQYIEPLPDQTGQEGKDFWMAFALSREQFLPPSQLVVRILSEEEE